MSSVECCHVRDFVVKNEMGNDIQLGNLLKPVTLIVNIDCKVGGHVNHECKDLQDLYLRYQQRGFEILAFPSDQFQIVSSQGQSLTAMDVKQDLMKRYGVTFPILHKVNVNGDNAHPLFMYLQKTLSGFPTNAIKWDFTKFLLVNGEPQKRYAPTSTVSTVETDISHMLTTIGTPDVGRSTAQPQPGLQQGYQGTQGMGTGTPGNMGMGTGYQGTPGNMGTGMGTGYSGPGTGMTGSNMGTGTGTPYH